MPDLPRRILTEHEVAERLSLSLATLRAWRSRRQGLHFIRLGRAVRYLDTDIERFVDSHRVTVQDAGKVMAGHEGMMRNESLETR